ncbi:MarR family transcriptional regulator [Bacillus sp. Bva_UNVM-123]|uniref:MarR family winged helix-turn-helix transcriptional regulator n=1 Tax=Bacillus sp. Bva_UNVM-123 TaxID=2829798 RepID=UPI00391F8D03
MQLQRLERSPRTFGEAGMLTPSEIHTIDAIGLNGDVLMSQLANKLSITKGAVTQLVSKLEKKELVLRKAHPTDSRAILLTLTKKGEIAFQEHQAMHQQFYRKLSQQLEAHEIAVFEKGLKLFTEELMANTIE